MLKVFRHTTTAKVPERQTEGAAGYDLSSDEDCCIEPGQQRLIGTGISIITPPHVYARIAPRSGLSVRSHCTIGAGVVDSDYRGEVKVLLQNLGGESVKIRQGERVAQLILERIETPEVIEIDHCGEENTTRGSNGFGSTGT
jgi:dUTP pyrophosphatase